MTYVTLKTGARRRGKGNRMMVDTCNNCRDFLNWRKGLEAELSRLKSRNEKLEAVAEEARIAERELPNTGMGNMCRDRLNRFLAALDDKEESK